MRRTERGRGDGDGGGEVGARIADESAQRMTLGAPSATRRVLAAATFAVVILGLVATVSVALYGLHAGWGGRLTNPVEAFFGGMMADMHESRIQENVPEPEDFDRLLTRDLETYFAEQATREVTVSFELLRDVPSQSGAAYPKFYAWVSVFEGQLLVEEGIMRIGVVNKEYFYVTHYFSADDARQNPDSIHEVFADDVCEKIEQKLR